MSIIYVTRKGNMAIVRSWSYIIKYGNVPLFTFSFIVEFSKHIIIVVLTVSKPFIEVQFYYSVTLENKIALQCV